MRRDSNRQPSAFELLRTSAKSYGGGHAAWRVGGRRLAARWHARLEPPVGGPAAAGADDPASGPGDRAAALLVLVRADHSRKGLRAEAGGPAGRCPAPGARTHHRSAP